jgi:hypothetical protein
VPVPSGAASGDIALVGIERYASGGGAYTGLATGFTEAINSAFGNGRITVFWKRLTGADSGSYTFSWSGSQWNAGMCMLITGGVATGTPYGGSGTNGAAGSASTVATTSVTSTDAPFLAHFVGNADAATGTPPTGFTELLENDYMRMSYYIPGTTGSHSAAGATMSVSNEYGSALLAIEPAAGAAATSLVVPGRGHRLGALLQV